MKVIFWHKSDLKFWTQQHGFNVASHYSNSKIINIILRNNCRLRTWPKIIVLLMQHSIDILWKYYTHHAGGNSSVSNDNISPFVRYTSTCGQYL